MEDSKVIFNLKKIVTNQFATIDKDIVEAEIIQLGAEINFGVDDSKKMLACFTQFQFTSQNLPFIILHVSCEFEIIETSWNSFIEVQNHKINFPVTLLQHLAIITIGSARGVLHAKTENSKFNKYFLPTINVKDFVKDGISFSMGNEK